MKYVDKNYKLNTDDPDVLFLGPLNLKAILAVDSSTLTSLQLFSSYTQLR